MCLAAVLEGNSVGMKTSVLTPPKAVLFDRDGTLVVDEPYNGDPALVRAMPGAREVLDRLRDAGILVGVISNQSGIARGLLHSEQVNAVNARIEELLGPFDLWEICPHGPADGCHCRKPNPGMVDNARRRLGLEAGDVAVVGDIGSDVEAAAAAGAVGVLVPTPVTREAEVTASPLVANDLAGAIDLLWDVRV